jgi:hypothetical protein
MNNSKRHSVIRFAVLLTCLCTFSARAEIRVSDDWAQNHLSITEQGRLPLEKDELKRMGIAANAMVVERNAVVQKPWSNYQQDQYFMLFVDGVKYYMQGAMFMNKTRPGEVCSVVEDKAPDGSDYHCHEGQRFKKSCHMLFMDSDFKDAGFYSIKVNEPYEYYCNAMPALGVASKQNNEFLVTVQYFPIDRKAASKVADVGSGWKRMTVLLRVKALDGKIQIEQDDACLKNPNSIETIPDARKALKQCRAKQ